MKPLLCHPIDYPTLLKLIHDDQWIFSQKLDGTRLLIDINDGKVTGYSRRGEVIKVPVAVRTALSQSLPEGHFAIDGELMGPMFNAFDLPIAGGLVGPTTPYFKRLAALRSLPEISGWWGPLTVLKAAEGVDAKAQLVRQLIEAKSEGVIARHVDGIYEEGKRPLSIVKCKFWRAIDCVVRKGKPDKEDFTLELLDGDEWIHVGGVSALTADGPRLKPGDVVEVTYLYATKERKLFQPILPRLRTDKAPEECTVDQLVYVNKEVL